MSLNNYDVIIIGAGAAGLFNANLQTSKGYKVLLLESHYAPGGCAGYFRRGNLQFDVGATTVSGLNENQPLGRLLHEISLKYKFEKQENLQISHPSKLNFKDLYQLELWDEIRKFHDQIWQMSWLSIYYPPKSIEDLRGLLNLQNLKFAKNVSDLFSPFITLLKKYKLNLSWLEIIDELLLISSQSKADKTPILMGMLALNYLDDLWYPSGGMGSLMQELAEHFLRNNGVLKLRTKVVDVSKIDSKFIVQTNKEIFQSKVVVSTLPIWNLKNITKLKLNLESLQTKFQPQWGARVGYFKIKFKVNPGHSYWQLHFKHEGVPSNSVFVSLPSKLNMQEFLPVTVSTHIDLKKFHENFDVNKRGVERQYWENLFINLLKDQFGENILDIVSMGGGDPHTFERYTSRFQGSVGGIPHDIAFPSYSFPQRFTAEKGFLLAGDTIFPGQGMPGLALGAFGIERAINQLFKSE